MKKYLSSLSLLEPKDKSISASKSPGVCMPSQPLQRQSCLPALATRNSSNSNKINFEGASARSQYMNLKAKIKEERVIYYTEYDLGKLVKHRLDFNSPRTKDAAARLGLTYEDCIKKYKSLF